MIDIKVPAVGESISEVTLIKWLKQNGQYVARDEVIAELESEKATFEVNAEQAGALQTIGKEGDTLKIGDILAKIDETAAKPAEKSSGNGQNKEVPATPAAPAPQEKAAPGAEGPKPAPAGPSASPDIKATPVAAAI